MKQRIASALLILCGVSLAHAVARAEPVPAVPEAESYLLLALGIGLVMYLARRR